MSSSFAARVPEDEPIWWAQLERLSDHVYGWTGNHVGLSEVSATDVRGEDHREAAALLRLIVPAGNRAANALTELLNLKDTAQYGLIPITQCELTAALRRAKALLDFADDVLRR